jgi:hypothetical protein
MLVELDHMRGNRVELDHSASKGHICGVDAYLTSVEGSLDILICLIIGSLWRKYKKLFEKTGGRQNRIGDFHVRSESERN